MRSTPFLLLGLLVTLTACNTVTTGTPLFAPADAQGAPPLRTGLWLVQGAFDGIPAPPCRFDARKPVRLAGLRVLDPGAGAGRPLL